MNIPRTIIETFPRLSIGYPGRRVSRRREGYSPYRSRERRENCKPGGIHPARKLARAFRGGPLIGERVGDPRG